MGHAKLKPTAPEPSAAFTVLPPPAAAPAKKPGLNLGGITAKKATASGKTYAVATGVDPEQLSALLEAKALEKKLKESTIPALEADLYAVIKPQLHQCANGSAEDSISILAHGTGTDSALFTMSKRYKAAPAPEDGELGPIVGDAFAAHFTIGTTLKIDLEKIPEEQRQPLCDAIIAAAAELGVTEAIEAKQNVVPLPGFHQRRRFLFTPEQNAELDARLPLVCSVRAR
jgi:hypothetical protein